MMLVITDKRCICRLRGKELKLQIEETNVVVKPTWVAERQENISRTSYSSFYHTGTCSLKFILFFVSSGCRHGSVNFSRAPMDCNQLGRLRPRRGCLPFVFQPSRQVPRPKVSCVDIVVWVLLRCDQKRPVHMGDTENAWEIWYARSSSFMFITSRYISNGPCQGPIVRISPYEIHVNDPEFLDVLYVGSSVRRSEKYAWAMNVAGKGDSSFETIDHDLHRVRRAVVAPFFSRASVQEIEPLVQSNVAKLVERLERRRGSGTIIKTQKMYGSLTGDIINQYALGSPYNLLGDPDFSPQWYQTWQTVSENCHLLNHFPWMIPLMRAMPVWSVTMFNPPAGALLGLFEVASFIPTLVTDSLIIQDRTLSNHSGKIGSERWSWPAWWEDRASRGPHQRPRAIWGQRNRSLDLCISCTQRRRDDHHGARTFRHIFSFTS